MLGIDHLGKFPLSPSNSQVILDVINSAILLSSSRALLNFNPEHKGAQAGCQLVNHRKEERSKKKKKEKKERRKRKNGLS